MTFIWFLVYDIKKPKTSQLLNLIVFCRGSLWKVGIWPPHLMAGTHKCMNKMHSYRSVCWGLLTSPFSGLGLGLSPWDHGCCWHTEWPGCANSVSAFNQVCVCLQCRTGCASCLASGYLDFFYMGGRVAKRGHESQEVIVPSTYFLCTSKV